MTILAAVDEKRQSNPVLETANDLARAYDDELAVLHVVPSADFEQHRAEIADLPGFDDYSFTQEEESAAEFAEELARETLGESAVGAVSGVGRVGDPVKMVLSVVEETDPRYLVVGGRRRSPAGKAVFGSKTQEILLGADVPVVTVMTDE